MQYTLAIPRPAALAAEYLIWSLAVAAVPGLLATAVILGGDPQDNYDDQAEIVRAFANWSMPVFMVAITPLGLGILRRAAMRVGHDLASVRRSAAMRGEQTTGRGLTSTSDTPMKSTIDHGGGKAVLLSALRLYLEYVVMVLLTPLVFILYGFVVGGARVAGNVFDLFSILMLYIAAMPGSLMAVRLVLRPIKFGLFANR